MPDIPQAGRLWFPWGVSTPDRRPARSEMGKVTRAYMQQIGWRSINLHTHISLVHEYAYFEVPKAGCGTMKATLGSAEAARYHSSLVEQVQANPHDRTQATPFVKPYQLSPKQLEEVFTSKKFKRFAVVREPASRVLSAYLEKIRQGLQQSVPVMEALTERLGADAPTFATDITLEQFVSVVVDQTSREQDPHWRRQVDLIGFGTVKHDAIIHLEELDDSWDAVAKLTGIADLQSQFYCRKSTGASSKVQAEYTPETLANIAKAYRDDYRAFGYTVPAI